MKYYKKIRQLFIALRIIKENETQTKEFRLGFRIQLKQSSNYFEG